MKKSILLLMVTVLLVTLTACGAQDKKVNLQKTGELYTTEEGVSFYYPSDYEISVSSNPEVTDYNTVEFNKDNNTLYFLVVNDESDNVASDKSELYTGVLEQGQASNIEVSKPVLNSGLDVYQYIYEYSDTGIKNKEIVYFLEADMTVYLESFSMTAGK